MGENRSPDALMWDAPATFPFSLRNAADRVLRLVASHTATRLTDSEFVGMANYVSESFHDLLAEGSKLGSNSDSNRGSHHPSRECRMVDTPEGNVEGLGDPSNANTPLGNPAGGRQEDVRYQSRLRLE